MSDEIKTAELAELIDFTTLLQVFNIEKKSLILQTTIENKSAYITFEKGEVVDAGVGILRGIDAFKKIVFENPKKIKIKKMNKRAKKTIDMPFMNLLLESVKNIDDINKNRDSEATKKAGLQQGDELSLVSLEDLLNGKFVSALDGIKGFSGCFVINNKGILVWKHHSFLDDVKISFPLVHNFVQKTDTKIFEKFSIKADYIILNSTKKKIFLKKLEINNEFYTLVLILDSFGNETMAKKTLFMLDELIPEL